MPSIIQLEQPDRRSYIGGSDVAAILGVSPWKSTYQLWAEKVGITHPAVDPAKEKIFARGKRLEPVVLQMFEDETGLAIEHRNRRFVDPEYPFLAAEIDAETNGENVDAKTAQPFARGIWGEQGSDDIPLYYTAQFMHGMMVTGRAVCHVAALIGLDDFRVFRIERDDELISIIRERELAFWELVQSQTPPPIETEQDATTVWPSSDADSIEIDSEIAQAVGQLKEVKAQIKALEKQEQILRDCIAPAFQNHEAIAFAGKIVATWKTQSATRLDQKALAVAHPELFEAFKTTSSTRVLRIK